MKNKIIFINHFKSSNKFIDSICDIKKLGYHVICIANNNENNALLYGDENIQVDLNDRQLLIDICKKNNPVLIHTSTDYLLPLIAFLYEELNLQNKPCGLKTAEIIINKFKFNQFLIENGYEEISVQSKIIKHESEFLSFGEMNTPIFCKPDIGCGARKVSSYDYCEFPSIEAFKNHLVINGEYENFLKTNVEGKITSHFTNPVRHVVQPFYESKHSYAIQVLYKNGKENFICFYDNFKTPVLSTIDPFMDPRDRNELIGSKRSWMRVGGVVYPYIPTEIEGYEKVLQISETVNHIFTKILDIQNLFVTYEITILENGRTIINDIGPRLSGFAVDTCPSVYKNFYSTIWNNLIESKNHIDLEPVGLGLRYALLLNPGKIKTIELPPDTEDIKFLFRKNLNSGQVIPELKTTVNYKSKIIVVDKNYDMDVLIFKMLLTLFKIQSTITYEE